MESFGDEKRVQRRVEAAIAIRIQGVDSSGTAYDDVATALEVSRRGLSFLTQLDLALFATLTITIPGRGLMRQSKGPFDFFSEATVVRCRKEDDGLNRIGVRFIGDTLPMYSAEVF
jgi:hypothetical protein